MLDISELVTDPDFSQIFTIHRRFGTWGDSGRFEFSDTSFTTTGVIIPDNSHETQANETGDQITGKIDAYTLVPIYPSMADQPDAETGSIADEIIWRDQRWRIIQTSDRLDNGYHKATAVRRLGD